MLFIAYLYLVLGKLLVFFCFHCCISTLTIVLKFMIGLDKLMITYYKNAEGSNSSKLNIKNKEKKLK